jgi:hypothetical protein
MTSSGCFNCHADEAVLRTFPYEHRPKAKYHRAPFMSEFGLPLCDFCYQYTCDNSHFPLVGRDEYDAWDGLVFPDENARDYFIGTQPLPEEDEEPMGNLVRQFEELLDDDSGTEEDDCYSFEDIMDDPECIVCWNTEDCSVHSIRYTLLHRDFVHPVTRDFVFCKECLSRVSKEDFSRVICTDDDDLLDNHISPLF